MCPGSVIKPQSVSLTPQRSIWGWALGSDRRALPGDKAVTCLQQEDEWSET